MPHRHAATDTETASKSICQFVFRGKHVTNRIHVTSTPNINPGGGRIKHTRQPIWFTRIEIEYGFFFHCFGGIRLYWKHNFVGGKIFWKARNKFERICRTSSRHTPPPNGPSAIGYKISPKVRFEVTHQGTTGLLSNFLPHVVGIHINVTATSRKAQ